MLWTLLQGSVASISDADKEKKVGIDISAGWNAMKFGVTVSVGKADIGGLDVEVGVLLPGLVTCAGSVQMKSLHKGGAVERKTTSRTLTNLEGKTGKERCTSIKS